MLANNPSVLTGGGVATNVVNGTFQLIGPTGSIALTAQGTNQNITLTPSGTGKIVVPNNSSILRLEAVTDSAYNTEFLNSYSAANSFSISTIGATWLQVLTSASLLSLSPTGAQKVLVGTTTNSSNGILQLATHTTSAGGIGFGTDWSAHRVDTSYFALSTSAGGATALTMRRGTTDYGWLYFDTVESFVEPRVAIPFSIRINGNPALKCDTSLNTTFSGIVIHKSYTVATLPAAAAGNTYGTTFVSDATNAAGTGIGTAPTGGGAVKRAVYSTGSAWLLL